WRLGRWENREAFPIRGEVKVRYPTRGANLCVRPETRLAGHERVSRRRVIRYHNAIVEVLVEQLPAGSRPHRVPAAAGGNLPSSTGCRKGAHVDFPPS